MNEVLKVKNQLKVISYIYFALTLGLILFFIVTIYLMENLTESQGKEIDKYFTIIVPLFGLLMMFFSRFIYFKLISADEQSTEIFVQIAQYRTAKIVSWALIERASLFALVAAILTLNYLYIAVFIFLFGYFLLSRPSKESFINDFRLKSEQSDKIFKSLL
jgi:hypothetical protein